MSAWQSICKLSCVACGARQEEMNPPAVNDRVIGAPHRGDEIRMRRRKGRSPHALDNAIEREAELVRLVQGNFKNAGDDLNATSKALSGGIDESQLFGLEFAVACDSRNDGRRRRTAALHDKRADGGTVLVSNVFEQRFLPGECSCRAV